MQHMRHRQQDNNRQGREIDTIHTLIRIINLRQMQIMLFCCGLQFLTCTVLYPFLCPIHITIYYRAHEPH